MTPSRLVVSIFLIATIPVARVCAQGNETPATTPIPPAQQSGPAAEKPPEAIPVKRRGHTKGDPLEGFNRAMFGLHEGLDKAIYRPAAMGYKHVVPKPLRSGFRNILSNLSEPFVAVNFLLQGKPGKAAETLGRLAINTTVGIGGLFDVAKSKDINLPHRNNSFGNTLALWGLGPGPYLFVPLFGPMTLRDALGEPVDDAMLPLAVGYPFDAWEYQIPAMVVGGLDRRAEADEELKALYADAVDRYATLRSVWLQNRAAEIEELRGHAARETGPALDELQDPLADPAAPGAAALSSPSQPPPRELDDPLEDPAAAPPASGPDMPPVELGDQSKGLAATPPSAPETPITQP